MTEDEIKAVHIANHRADQAVDRAAVAWIDSGGRHFDQLPGTSAMVDSTNRIRGERLAHIDMLENLVGLWSRPNGLGQF